MSVVRRFSVFALVVLSAFAMTVCGGGEPAKPQPQVEQPAPPPLGAHMQDHFTRVAHVRDAVIRAEIEDVKQPATWLAGHEKAPGLPASADAPLAEMRRAARQVVDSTDFAAVAKATAALAGSCGACHTATGAKVAMPAVGPAVADKGAKEHMQNHRRAMELLYEGLVGPSADAWTSGAMSLEGAPLTQPVKNPKLAAELKKLATAVHTLAGVAARAADQPARVGVYGELLTTCANCHNAQGIILGTGLPKGL